MQKIKIIIVLGLLISLAAITADAQETATVRVKCNNGQKINQALKHRPNADNLIIEIEGMCNENVMVTRDRVTLKGTDPASDGIQAVSNTTPIDVALWVRGAHQVSVENLKLTGGFAGLLASEVSTPFLLMKNCRLEGNTNYGVQLESALLQAENSVFSDNGFINAGVFLSSRFGCNGCTLANPGGGIGGTTKTNLLLFQGSIGVISNSTFTDGGINANGASAFITDSSVDGNAPNASLSASQGAVNLTRVQVGGPLRFVQSSNALLSGVTQTRSETPNLVDDNSYTKIGNAAPATGGGPSIPSVVFGFNLSNFSTSSLLGTSQINGNVTCSAGANKFCANPANVSGASTCGLCPKP
jgi:hypothetical protein